SLTISIRYRALQGLLDRTGRALDQILDGLCVRFDRVHDVAFGDQFLPGHDDADVFRNAAQHEAPGRIVNDVDGEEDDLVVGIHRANAAIARTAQRYHRTRQQRRRNGRCPQRDFRGHARGNDTVLVGNGDFDAECARSGRRIAADVTYAAFDFHTVD